MCGPGRIESIKNDSIKLINMPHAFKVSTPLQMGAIMRAFTANYRVVFFAERNCDDKVMVDVEIIKDDE